MMPRKAEVSLTWLNCRVMTCTPYYKGYVNISPEAAQHLNLTWI